MIVVCIDEGEKNLPHSIFNRWFTQTIVQCKIIDYCIYEPLLEAIFILETIPVC